MSLTSPRKNLFTFTLRALLALGSLARSIIGVMLCGFLASAALPLLGMFFSGNLLRKCLITDRLARAARTALVDTVAIVPGRTVGARFGPEGADGRQR